jgi:hypothetical protein
MGQKRHWAVGGLVDLVQNVGGSRPRWTRHHSPLAGLEATAAGASRHGVTPPTCKLTHGSAPGSNIYAHARRQRARVKSAP